MLGLRFIEDCPHAGQARTRGTVIITPYGILSVRPYTVPGHRWLTALRHVGTLHPDAIRPGAPTAAPTEPVAPSWSLRPHRKDRSFSGHLHPADHVEAATLTELPDTIGDVNALLTLTPPATEPRAPTPGDSPPASSTCSSPAHPPTPMPSPDDQHRPPPFGPAPQPPAVRGRPTSAGTPVRRNPEHCLAAGLRSLS
ncbi:hypothetical protein [Streptomyces sp. NPDC058145]|uniref:hypothetical protein n=1 Tax=Streptomyces sp. NPDC058145 TaxID=3346356 RepID=UPI0036ED6395